MSIYDYRDRPVYSNFKADAAYCTNSHVLKWWTPAHDDLLARRIEEEQWNWPWGITNSIVKITSPETIETWKREDPKCSMYAWYNVLMYFAMSRADSLGLSNRIRQPKDRICPFKTDIRVGEP